MVLLVSGATADVQQTDPDRVGVLFVPADRNAAANACGRIWGLDNGAFSDFDANAFTDALERYRGVPGCRFVTCPDVVGDALTTLRKFRLWAPMIRALGYPVALVAQDGLTVEATPWDAIDALFIGGTTAWKLSRQADELLAYASARGKWRHVGRVNSRRRIEHVWGRCDSIDGSGFSWFPKRIGLALRWFRELETQGTLQWCA